MLLHLQVLFRRELAGLVQQVVGHAHLADVVQRRKARQEIDALRGQVVAKRRMLRQLLGEQAAVLLNPPRMPAGIGVAHFGQRQERAHHQPLRQILLASGSVRTPPLLGDPRERGGAERRHHPDDRKEGRQVLPPHRELPAHREPDRHQEHRAGNRAERQPDSRHQQRDGDAEREHGDDFDRQRVLGPRQEIAAQQIVGDRRLNFDAGEPRIERRRHHLPAAERRGPDEDDGVLEDVSGIAAGEHVDRRDVGKRTLRATVAEEQVASAVERNRAGGELERRGVLVLRAQGNRRRAGRRENRRERKSRVGGPVVIDDQGHAPEDAVGVRHGVEEAGPAGGSRQRRQAADRALGVKQRDVDAFVLRLDHGDGEGMEDAVAAAAVGPERQRVAEHDPAFEPARAPGSRPTATVASRRYRSDRVRRRPRRGR